MEDQESYKYDLDKTLEVVTWLTITFVLMVSYVLFKEEVNFPIIVILSLILLAVAEVFYRAVPKERKGAWGYSFEFKNFIVGILNIILASLILFFSGGLESPFFFLYFLVIVAGTLGLFEKYVVFELLLILLFMFAIAFPLDQLILKISLPRFLSIIILSLIAWQTGRIIIYQKEELGGLNRFKSDFISMSLHYIRNPLTSLRWFLADIFIPKLSLSQEQKQDLNRIYESVLGLIFLINNLRDLVRLEIDKVVHIQRIDILKITQDAAGGFTTIIRGRGLGFAFKKPKEKSLFVDSDLLFTSDVIKNLIFNSIIYNKPKGKILVGVEKKEGKARIRVEDTGIGIYESEQEKIFTKFFRSDQAKVLNSNGAGLSLYMARLAVRACGGEIWFESEYGKGTKFYFTLPLG